MQQALDLANQARSQNEIPVGAIIVHQDQVIGRGFNQTIKFNDPTAHAEILALREAGKAISNYRLLDSIMYVTLEPCAMCAYAMVHARIKRVVFGAYDLKTGAAGSVINIFSYPWNHNVDHLGGVLSDKCGELLQQFFCTKR